MAISFHRFQGVSCELGSSPGAWVGSPERKLHRDIIESIPTWKQALICLLSFHQWKRAVAYDGAAMIVHGCGASRHLFDLLIRASDRLWADIFNLPNDLPMPRPLTSPDGGANGPDTFRLMVEGLKLNRMRHAVNIGVDRPMRHSQWRDVIRARSAREGKSVIVLAEEMSAGDLDGSDLLMLLSAVSELTLEAGAKSPRLFSLI